MKEMAKAIKFEKEVKFTRILNASRELIFDVWTDPKHLAQWWGPHGFTSPVCKVDLRVDGDIIIDMRGPDGTVVSMTGRYKEIERPERLVFTASALDEKGKPLFEVINTVTLTEEEGRTKMTLHAGVHKLRPEGKRHIDGMKEGWTQSLERFEEYILTI
jgi:uncharacterized protein YndB with AHSA1/START domain